MPKQTRECQYPLGRGRERTVDLEWQKKRPKDKHVPHDRSRSDGEKTFAVERLDGKGPVMIWFVLVWFGGYRLWPYKYLQESHADPSERQVYHKQPQTQHTNTHTNNPVTQTYLYILVYTE